MIDDVLRSSNNLYNLMIYGLAIFYISDALVDLLSKPHFGNKPIINFKPFNCQFCMAGWISIMLACISRSYLFLMVPFAVAGFATIVWKIKMKLEAFVI